MKLRPDLTNDNTEIWEISGEVKGALYGVEDVEKELRKKAAEKSNKEGRNCFLVLENETDAYNNSNSFTMMQTMQARSNYSTNYYSNTGYQYGSASGQGKYTYQAPVTYNLSYQVTSVKWFVIFYSYNQCMELKGTKWRENVYFNNEILAR